MAQEKENRQGLKVCLSRTFKGRPLFRYFISRPMVSLARTERVKLAIIKAGAATGDGYGPAPCRRSNRGNIVATSYTTSKDRVTLKAGAISNTPNGSCGM